MKINLRQIYFLKILYIEDHSIIVMDKVINYYIVRTELLKYIEV